ncbi:hypothetical protein [Streptomyces sp. NBC_00286]|uniref:hypothetical protein n=1 Tax=Streptomyces sp. NBC_00286 TaxID=2975701 RepID=UPI002E2DEAB6|nr:hypothetical protein [Streptomyces sp. NBC_00286]
MGRHTPGDKESRGSGRSKRGLNERGEPKAILPATTRPQMIWVRVPAHVVKVPRSPRWSMS